jgi:hypothetical protein
MLSLRSAAGQLWARRRTEALLLTAAVVCYLPGLFWGLPEASSAERVSVWAYDNISPLPALAEIYQTLIQPGPDRWLAYPPLHHYLLGAAYAPYLGWLALTGRFAHPSPVFPYGLDDPVGAFRTLTLIARLISILMAAGIVVAVYRIGLTLWDRRTGLWSSLAVMAAYPMFYYSKTACLEVPYLFWASLATLAYAQILSDGPGVKRMAFLGAFAAMAAATKDQAAGLFLLLPIPLAQMHRRNQRGEGAGWEAPAALLGAGGVAYALGSGMVFDFERYLAHVRWILRPEGMLSEQFVSWYPESIWMARGAEGIIQRIGVLLDAQVRFLGPALIACAAVALIQTARRQRAKLWLAFPALSYLVTFLMAINYFQLRYAMPVMVFLALFAGRGLAWLQRRVRSGLAFALVALMIFAWPAHSSARLVRHLLRDTRLEAERWLRAGMAPGDRIAAAHEINALPRLPRDVVILKLPPGPAALDRLKAQQPEFVSVIPDWSSAPGSAHSRAYPRELFEQLDGGSLGYALAAQFDSGFWSARPLLDYPAVSPPVRIYRRIGSVRRGCCRKEATGPSSN